jgi:hypothetical protein
MASMKHTTMVAHWLRAPNSTFGLTQVVVVVVKWGGGAEGFAVVGWQDDQG